MNMQPDGSMAPGPAMRGQQPAQPAGQMPPQMGAPSGMAPNAGGAQPPQGRPPAGPPQQGPNPMQMQQMALESSRRRERRLISVDQALKRLEKQIYGICVDCDEDINVRRLEIDPTALRCIKCAEALSK